MDWDKLKGFYYVASLGTITLAAEKMGLNQSSISRQILALEKYLNTKLFYRRQSGSVLTRQGRLLFEAAQKIYAQTSLVEKLIREEAEKPEGTLRVAVIAGVLTHYLIPLIPEFMQRYPDIHLSIRETIQMVDLSLGEEEVLIHSQLPPQPCLMQEQLAKFHLRLFASPAYLKERGTPLTPQDLDAHDLIAYGPHRDHPFPQSNWHLGLGRPLGDLRRSRIDVDTTAGRFYLASQGLGIASLPLEHPPLAQNLLVPVLPDQAGPVLEASLIYPEDMLELQKFRVFRSFLLEKFCAPSKTVEEDKDTLPL